MGGLTWTGSSWLLSSASFVQPALHGTSSHYSQTESLAVHESAEATESSKTASMLTSSVPLLIGSSCVASAIATRPKKTSVRHVACEALPTPSASIDAVASKEAAAADAADIFAEATE